MIRSPLCCMPTIILMKSQIGESNKQSKTGAISQFWTPHNPRRQLYCLQCSKLQAYDSIICIWSGRTHTRAFNGPFSRTTRVSRYQNGKTNLDFTEARDSEWQWHQLGHMQVCTSLQTDNHASTPPRFFTGRMPFPPPNQQHQSTGRTHGWI